jgi:hypothetical protein
MARFAATAPPMDDTTWGRFGSNPGTPMPFNPHWHDQKKSATFRKKVADD